MYIYMNLKKIETIKSRKKNEEEMNLFLYNPKNRFFFLSSEKSIIEREREKCL